MLILSVATHGLAAPSRPKPPAPLTSRSVAHRVLLRCARDGAFADRALSAELDAAPELPAGGRRHATELVYGVMRNSALLDHHLGQLTNLTRADLKTRTILRIGAHETLHLRTADHAALNEAVALGKNRVQRSYVNGVLRSLVRGRDADTLVAPESLAVRTSTPQWLLDDVAASLDDADEVAAWAEASQQAPRLALRVNAHRCDPDAALAALVAAGADAEAHPAVGGSLLVRGGGAPHKLPGFAEGHWTVQDAAATLIGTLAAPAAGDRVALELCAAPGGKTTHTASLLQPSGGVVVAVELHARKLKLIAEASSRLGVADAVRAVAADATDVGALRAALAEHADGAEAADAVLVDAPCSGMGTLRRNPEHRAKVREQLDGLPALQGRLLDAAAEVVRVGGAVTYSICTPRREEGDDVLAAFLARKDGAFVLETIDDPALTPFAAARPELGGDVLQTWTHRHELDSHFAARLRRVR